jgi:phenylalanine-4-hydroxylase
MTSASDSEQRLSLLLELDDRTGALRDLLAHFTRHDVSLTHIESRPARDGRFDFYVDCEGAREDPRMQALLADLEASTNRLLLLDEQEVPWFPRRIEELDRMAAHTLDAGADLEADHPGFRDADYRARRARIDALAKSYRYGDPIPEIEYTDAEHATWREVWERVAPLHERYAARSYLEIRDNLRQRAGFGPERIPQARELSDYLVRRTGFRIRPVPGLLASRDFLAGLAFRVFFATQYIRHHSKPLYTPEPDVCHEFMGHVPMFADPAFADLSQEIGLASLGASDAEIERLARCYWFSVEFGLVREDGALKAYGAGLLSSFGELEYACSPDRPAGGVDARPELRSWMPADAAEQDFPITEYQPVYFVADSLADASERMRAHCEGLPRPFYARYNAMTRSIWVDRSIRREA